jgi:stage II sporulation protein D
MTRLLRASALIALGIVAAVPLLAQNPSPTRSPHPPATLRIGLWTLWHDKQISISPAPEGSSTLRICEECKAVSLAGAEQVRALGGRVSFANNREAAALWITGGVTLAAHGESLMLSNPLHIAARNGVLVLDVALPIEGYVERVVASESSAADSSESLRALAIVVRSFALHQKHGHPEYDLCDSTHCQLLHWGGNPERRAAAHAATLSTSGQTLWFHGQRAEAWFHQNCGGRTASPAEVWPGHKPMPWLAPRTDSYCTAGGAREWSANLSRIEISAALAADGLVRPGWRDLTVARRGESGRIVTLRANSTEMSAEEFRLAVGRSLGWNRILSNWFEVTRQGDRFFFHGRGSGHGVGLCQAGAAAMAANGRSSRQIIAQYFSGATVADETSGLSWQTVSGQGFTLETLDPANATYLPSLSRSLAEAESRSGLKPARPFTVRVFSSTPAFRDATLAPGWVAAFTEGDWIGIQPLRTLAGRKMLDSVLRHEFLHALVESQSAANAPLWLREGLVESWSGETATTGPSPALKLGEVDRALARAASEAEFASAHRAAGWYAARLLSRFGRDRVLGWLRSGVPSNAMAAPAD